MWEENPRESFQVEPTQSGWDGNPIHIVPLWDSNLGPGGGRCGKTLLHQPDLKVKVRIGRFIVLLH